MRRVIPLLLVLGGCATQQPAPDYYGRCVVEFGFPAGTIEASQCAQSLAERADANRAAMGAAWLGAGGMRPMQNYNLPMPSQPVKLPGRTNCQKWPDGQVSCVSQ